MEADFAAPSRLLVLGVISAERQIGKRQRLRRFYEQTAPGSCLVKYVVSSRWLLRRVQAPDEVGVNVTDPSNCAHKALSWWRLATQWSSRWYGKTDGTLRHEAKL